jgi:hypothetical protein
MTTALICERWPMPLHDGGAELTDGWFAAWVRRRPRESSTHIAASYAAYHALATAGMTFATAYECFGGMGCQSLIIRNLFAPRTHHVVDNHPDAVAHLRRLLDRPGETVHQTDSYQTAPTAELVGLDFGDFTAHQAHTRARPLLERTFAAAPRAAVLTDIAGPRLHLHRRRYSSLLDHPCDTYRDYLQGLAGWLGRQFGYRPLAIYEHRWSALLALVPGQPDGPAPVRPVPQQPEGIRLG